MAWSPAWVEGVERFQEGARIGIPWLGYTCGRCRFCSSGKENLCDAARFTGYQIDGGYAEYTLADARYCFPIHGPYDDAEAAPLLCAGLIGYRSLCMAGDGERLGIYGFGAAAHIVAQVARHQGRRVFAFTRAGDRQAQEFARELGAVWAGSSDERPPEELDAAIIFAPVGPLIPAALQAVTKGGVVVAGGIHMSDIPSFPYRILWGERVVRSVANLTRSRCGGVPRARAQGAGRDRNPALLPGRCQPRAGRAPRGSPARRRRAGPGLVSADRSYAAEEAASQERSSGTATPLTPFEARRTRRRA